MDLKPKYKNQNTEWDLEYNTSHHLIDNRKVTRHEFTTFQDLEKYFTRKLLLQKNIKSKVIGKVLLVWNKQKEAA